MAGSAPFLKNPEGSSRANIGSFNPTRDGDFLGFCGGYHCSYSMDPVPDFHAFAVSFAHKPLKAASEDLPIANPPSPPYDVMIPRNWISEWVAGACVDLLPSMCDLLSTSWEHLQSQPSSVLNTVQVCKSGWEVQTRRFRQTINPSFCS